MREMASALIVLVAAIVMLAGAAACLGFAAGWAVSMFRIGWRLATGIFGP